ncbi:MAG TPA: GIY-YIG nuclease family protein [Patescibacteria group bacterium]|nr:GIY-YIG nuclease family protein [Patescibacteria group bacterium]
MPYTYILQSDKDGKYYIGSASDLEARLARHARGGSVATKNRRPLRLVYQREFATTAEAIKFEKYLKSLKSHQVISDIIAGL